MAKRKRVQGIKIDYQLQRTRGQGVRVEFGFSMKSGHPSKNFFSYPDLRERIKDVRKKMKIKTHSMDLGKVILHYFPEKRTAHWYGFMPFYVGNSLTFLPELVGVGAGQLLELRVIKKMHQLFPNLKTLAHLDATEIRRDMLAKRGIQLNNEGAGKYSLKKGMDSLKAKIKRDVTAKKKKRLSKRPH